MIFAASLTCAALYIYIWHKHFDVNFTLIFTLIPIACLGYLLSALAHSLEAAIIGQQIIYIGGSFLQLFIVFSIFNLCKVEVPKYLRLILFAFCAIVYASVLTIGHLDWFYTKVSFEMIGSRPVLHKEYGIMHTVFYVLVCLYLITGIITIIYSWIRKKEIPRRILIMLIFPDIVCVVNYFIILKVFNLSVDLVPLGYIFAQLIYLLIAYRVNLYDVSNTVIDSFVQEQKVGYISFDFNLRYLGSNQVAKDLVPELNDIAIDELFGYKPSQRKIRHFLDSFRQNNENNTFVYVVNGPDDDSFEDDQFYNVNVNYLYDGKWKRGYIITFIDDTPNKKYIKLLDNYNDTLKKEVDDKTRHIVEMHDKSDEFCKDVIKAAPMHDLGKIAVDHDILRKPGRFTPEEFEKMKAHAAEGAKVIHEILLHTDDDSFKKVAENVAHYHHERWDGSGYP